LARFGAERAGFLCEALVHRSDFGLIFNIPLEFGGVVVGDEVKIELSIETILKK
jgi:polyisoprenoid-binding protein YceI